MAYDLLMSQLELDNAGRDYPATTPPCQDVHRGKVKYVPVLLGEGQGEEQILPPHYTLNIPSNPW